MAPDSSDLAGSFRQRAGETKRARTRLTLIAAARACFTAHGWQSTRFEDIAEQAGVSAATAYKHFSGKHELVALAYAPLLEPVWVKAKSYLASGEPALTAIEMHLHDLDAAARGNLRLTVPFLEAVWDSLVRLGSPPTDPADPRVIVPMPTMLTEIVAAGQARGELRPSPSAEKAAIYVINGMMLEIATHLNEPIGETARVAMQFARGALEIG